VAGRGKFDPARHPRDRFGRFTKSRTVRASAKDKKAARDALDGFTPKQIDDRRGYLEGIGGRGEPVADLAGVNKALRAGDEHAAGVDTAEQSMIALPDDLLLSRSVPSSAFGHLDPESLQGMKVRDAGFSATQLGTVQALPDSVRMHIAAPAGTRAAVNPATGEVLLDRDTELVVSKVERNSAGGHDMYLTVLSKAGAPDGSSSARPEPDGLEKLTVAELQQKMREQGLKPGRMRKADMIAALQGGQSSAEPDGTPPPAAVSVEDRVRKAIADIHVEDGSRTGDLVSLARVREKLGDLSRTDQDAALRKLDRDRSIQLDPEPNRKALTDRSRQAAIQVGGEDKHLVSLRATPDSTDDEGLAPDEAASAGVGQPLLALAQAGVSRATLASVLRTLLDEHDLHGVETPELKAVVDDVTGPRGQIRQAIEEALAAAGMTAGIGNYVNLAEVRRRLPAGLDRATVDRELQAMAGGPDPDITLAPESNQKALTDVERAAAVSRGNQDKHLVALDGGDWARLQQLLAALAARSPARSVRAAASDPGSAAEIQQQWQQAKAALLKRWPKTAKPMVDELADQASSADTARLGELAVSAGVISAVATVLTKGGSDLAQAAAAGVVAEAANQQVTIDAPTKAGADTVRDTAAAIAGIIASGYASGAARAALQLAGTSPAEVKAAVAEQLTDLGTSENGLVGDNIGALLSAAQHAGRLAVLERHPANGYIAEERNDDGNRCRPCAEENQKRFATLAEALKDYPTSGYVRCEGRSRCRGHIRPLWT
jgi:hypothetical protein